MRQERWKEKKRERVNLLSNHCKSPTGPGNHYMKNCVQKVETGGEITAECLCMNNRNP